MNLIVVRHAEKESFGEDPFLSQKGIKQAKHLAKRLNKVKIDEFYCSDMNRAKQTSSYVTLKIKMKPVIEKVLNEFEAETLIKKKAKWNKIEKNHYNSVAKFIERITKYKENDKTILIIAHGLTNRVILSHLMKVDLNNLIPFMQNETGVNIFSWNSHYKNWRVHSWNDNSHIPNRLK